MYPKTVREVMTGNVVTVREDASYREIVHPLTTNHISTVPVVDQSWPRRRCRVGDGRAAAPAAA